MINKIQKIEKWADDRGFFCPENGTDVETQYYKLLEENGEMYKSLLRKRTPLDDIGDQFVVLVIANKLSQYDSENLLIDTNTVIVKPKLKLAIYNGHSASCIIKGLSPYYHLFSAKAECLNQIAKDNNLTLEECIDHAYSEIKDRKGKFVNRAYVKEEDLNN